MHCRFTPVDPRCAMELDEIAPSEWVKLEAATDEYIAAVSDQLDDCVAVLTAGLPDANSSEGTAGPAAAAALRLGASMGNAFFLATAGSDCLIMCGRSEPRHRNITAPQPHGLKRICDA